MSAKSTALEGLTLITNDATSLIDSGNTYTHAVDFGSGPSATVNSVVFSSDLGVAAGGRSNAGTRTVGSSTNIGSTPPNVTGSVESLFRDFRFNTPTGYLELTGLTNGVDYEVKLYDRPFNPALRTMQLDYVVEGVTSSRPIYDQEDATALGFASDAVCWSTNHQYTAGASGIIRINCVGFQYHFYGLTNEET